MFFFLGKSSLQFNSLSIPSLQLFLDLPLLRFSGIIRLTLVYVFSRALFSSESSSAFFQNSILVINNIFYSISDIPLTWKRQKIQGVALSYSRSSITRSLNKYALNLMVLETTINSLYELMKKTYIQDIATEYDSKIRKKQ